MPVVLLAYLVSAYVVCGFTCYLAFLRQSNQDYKSSRFNLMLLSNIWILGLWPFWIVRESFRDERDTDSAQEHLEVNCLPSCIDCKACAQAKLDWSVTEKRSPNN